MRLLFTVIACLFLWGCSPQAEIPPAPSEPALVTEDPALAVSYGTAVKAYALAFQNTEQMLPFGDGYLLKSRQNLLKTLKMQKLKHKMKLWLKNQLLKN